jgi:monovalent cation:H+ antiporter, CPA1 family
MTLYQAFSVLMVLAACFAYINFRYFKLPYGIGLMLLALLTSLTLFAAGNIFPAMLQNTRQFISNFNFSDLLMGSMLSFMLFAGAIHVKLDDLNREKIQVLIFSTISVIISTLIIGVAMYFLLDLFNIHAQFISCLVFGSLISPTDPITVFGILKEAKISRSLEVKIAGESLFNDGIAVVVFVTLLEFQKNPAGFQWSDMAWLFIREAMGGLVWGIIVGYAGFLLMKSIDNYKVEILISLAVVMGGYSLADWLHISGPLAMVAAGIIIGNHGKKHAMSNITADYIDKFWELTDEILNAVLFVLMGLELLVIHFIKGYFLAGIVAIFIVLLTRYISILIPSLFIKLKEYISHKTIIVLTWGGLRGGISIALALSLKPEMQKELWLIITYFIVAFSILVQGLTIGKLVKKLTS